MLSRKDLLMFSEVLHSISKIVLQDLSEHLRGYPFTFNVPVRHACHSSWDRSAPMRPSRRPIWQPACPFLVTWNHFCTCEAPAPAGAVVILSLPGRPAAAAGMLPWAQGFAILYTTLVAACMPIISLGGLLLAENGSTGHRPGRPASLDWFKM